MNEDILNESWYDKSWVIHTLAIFLHLILSIHQRVCQSDFLFQSNLLCFVNQNTVLTVPMTINLGSCLCEPRAGHNILACDQIYKRIQIQYHVTPCVLSDSTQLPYLYATHRITYSLIYSSVNCRFRLESHLERKLLTCSRDSIN